MKGRNEKKKSNKRKVAILTTLIALFAILAGTFAWKSYTEWVKNHMQSRGYEEGRVTIVENFKPQPIDENPKITKDVKVVNTSSSDSFVRISFEEMLQKLAAGAQAQGYDDASKTGFPVIVNSTMYTNNDAGYTLLADNQFAIKKADGTAVATPAGLKVYISADGNSAGLYIEKSMLASDFPKNFDFLANDATVPVVSGSFAGGDAKVAQKVTGKVEKQPDGTYVFYTDKYTKEEENFRVWGYGKGLDTAKEADWAGENQFVTATVAAGTVGQSSVDAGITFEQPDVDGAATDIKTATKDWFYNKGDGYFYYTKVLKAGATTTSVMKSVSFPDATTDQTFKMASYDLYVGLEAIPATQAALSAASNGGKLGSGAVTEGNKTWESNGAGWGLAVASDLYKYFAPLATITE